MTLRRADLELAGRLERPDGIGSAGGSACGDRVRLELALDGGMVADVRFTGQGCAAALSAAAWCARRSRGLPFLDAARLSVVECLAETGLDPDREPCAAVALDALAEALGDALPATQLPLHEGRVAVALSGGVDSAVALLRVRDAGDEPVGLTLRLWIDPAAPSPERACCAPEAVRRARATCHALGLPHVTLDGRDAFRRTVVEPFVAAYAAGRTPNPCTTCNGSYRMEALVAAGDRLGAPIVATGHYARLVEREGRTLLARAADEDKDQSYMLAAVPPALLRRLRFPLGQAHKDEVRAEAAAAGLAAAAAAPESQDVCFLGGGALRDFLGREGVGLGSGNIVDEEGSVVGRHSGAAAFTPGQRRGLGVAASRPLYVLRTDPARNVVVAGPRERLGRSMVELREAVLHRPAARAEVRLRNRAPAVGARIESGEEAGALRLRLDEQAYAVAAGQTAVLYEDGAVIGSGTIV
jgi:tRNA-specific 2-thiouridylase